MNKIPKILLSKAVEIYLTAWKLAVGGLEFSGLGEVERNEDGDFLVKDVYLMDVGTAVFTDITPDRIVALPYSDTRKLWFHRHPVGNGVAGPHNWSGTDHHTATKEPLGGIPQMVKWSIAIVYTPSGWTGRIDFHQDTGTKTYYTDVLPQNPSEEVIKQALPLLTPELREYVAELKDEFNYRHTKHGVLAESDDLEEWDENDGDYSDVEVTKEQVMAALEDLPADDVIFRELSNYLA